ncbi:MAG TPA: hypothetical protein VF219_00965 [Vicinamibacterales bacterium]
MSMRAAISLGLVLLALSATVAAAQTKKPPVPATKKPAVPAVALTKIAPPMICQAPLGIGVKTKTSFCEILAGRDPENGVLIKLPSRRGPATLTFDLHNLQLYSEEQIKAKRAYAKYTATIGVLTMDNTLISRAVVQSEFRTAADLVDRVSGGAGPGGVKAVAPTGVESIVVTIPDSEEQVSLLGEKLVVEGMTGGPSTFTQTGRPIAVISNMMLEYRPAPPKPPPKKTR